MKVPSKAELKTLAMPRVHERGRALASKLKQVELRGDTLSADAPSSLGGEGYKVSVRVVDGKLDGYECNCDHHMSGACKHAVALLARADRDLALDILPDLGPAADPEPAPVAPVAYATDSPSFEEMMAMLRERLGPANADRRNAILLKRASDNYRSANAMLHDLDLAEASGTGRPLPLAPIREIAYGDASDQLDPLREDEEGFEEQGEDAGAMERFLELSREFGAKGDHLNAVRVLVAVTEGLVRAADPIGEPWDPDERRRLLGKLARRVAKPLAEAALADGIPAGDRIELAARLGPALDLVEVRPGDAVPFAAPRRAIAAGWDAPDVVAVMEGTAASWPDPEAAEAEKALLPLRLARLDGRPAEAGRIQAASVSDLDAALGHVAARRPAEAVALAARSFALRWQAHRLCASLLATGHAREFAAVAAQGLGLPGSAHGGLSPAEVELRFARLVRDAVLPKGTDPAVAADVRIRAGREAFALTRSEDDYVGLKRAAGARWSDLRAGFVAEAAAAPASPDIVRVLLSEGEQDAACAMAGDGGILDDRDLGLMASVLGRNRVDWVSRAFRARGEAIASAGRTNEYRVASSWMAQAGEALLAAGRHEDCMALVGELRRRYSRRAKLKGYLDAIETRFERQIEKMPSAAKGLFTP